jgi:eukaryotic-like serine/threonine-protein kinase
MKKQKDRRLWPREVPETSKSGIVYVPDADTRVPGQGKASDALLLNVLNMSKKGLLLRSPLEFRAGALLDMRVWNPHKKVWMATSAKVRWAHGVSAQNGHYLLGVEFDRRGTDESLCDGAVDTNGKRMSPADLDFLLNTRLLVAMPQESVCPLLNSLTYRHIKAGERVITQGDDAEELYIIRSGSCIVSLEKEGEIYPVTRLRSGDIVGEMAVLTGEPRSMNVDAETDMNLWSLGRAQFDALAAEFPDIRIFLTEIITQRFAASKLTSNRTIGKYIINEILGKGGWSIVYKGVHRTLNFPVAVKMLKHNMAMDSDFMEKFRNEAKTIAGLNHPNIVKVYDIEEVYRTVFIVMEYLEGYTLEYMMEYMPKPSKREILDIILQICGGLEYAHKHGIVHQDIKPGNIFLHPDGSVKIVDFGLACPKGDMDFNLPGTVFYMAPEQIEGKPVDERTDIYAFGIMMYEILLGKRPFPEADLSRLMDLHMKEEVPDPRNERPDIPDELVNAIMKSARRNPAERFRNISELVRELQPLADRMGLACSERIRERRKMTGLFLFYRDEHSEVLNGLIDKFSSDVAESGAVLKITQLEDV